MSMSANDVSAGELLHGAMLQRYHRAAHYTYMISQSPGWCRGYFDHLFVTLG